MNKYLYFYKAIVTDVYDADTITVDISLGFGLWSKGEKIRLSGIDAPEVRGEEREKGIIARDYLRGWILNKEVLIQTVKDKKGKYGRYLATIWVFNQDLWISVNATLVHEGYAEFKDY